MIVCDRCNRYASSCCRDCFYFDAIYGSITGDYVGQRVTAAEADRELREMFPEDFHCMFVARAIRMYRFVARVVVPFLLYDKWNRPRQVPRYKPYYRC